MTDHLFQDESKVREVAQQLSTLLNKDFDEYLATKGDLTVLVSKDLGELLTVLTKDLIYVTAAVNADLVLPFYQRHIDKLNQITEEERNTK